MEKVIKKVLKIDGILLTMVDMRTNHAKDIANKVHEAYGANVEIFKSVVPLSVRAAETSAEGKSIFVYEPKGKVSKAYQAITEEVLGR